MWHFYKEKECWQKKMRPVNKGEAPCVYIQYSEAKDDLREALGAYCSYCEMNITNGMDIEHVSPKSKNPTLSVSWDNFLIACKVCNRLKSNVNDCRGGYIFPDTHNTAYAYQYSQQGVAINNALDEAEQQLALNTLNLVQLNRTVDSTKRKDDRYVQRLVEWDKAQESLKDYEIMQSPEMKRQVVRSHAGFISSWLEIFKDYPEVKQGLLESIKGSNFNCYDDFRYFPVAVLELTACCIFNGDE